MDDKLGKIGAVSDALVPFEIQEFEVQMNKLKIHQKEDWYRYFEHALVDRLRDWLKGAALREPLSTHLTQCFSTGATDWHWAQAYQAARFEVLITCGADLAAAWAWCQAFLDFGAVPREGRLQTDFENEGNAEYSVAVDENDGRV
jgi:hypothetical protein